MKRRIWISVLCMACAAQSTALGPGTPRRSGFFGGVGYLSHTDFFIFTKWGDSGLERTVSSLHPFLGYVRVLGSENLGLSVTAGGSWFRLPDFGIDLFPDAPADMGQTIDYSSVKMALYVADFSLLVMAGARWTYEAGFSFGYQSDSKTRYELGFGLADPFNPRTWRITECKAFPIGGAVLGVTYDLTRRLALAARGRLIVGRGTSSGYALYVNGVRMGDPYGGTDYMKQASVGLLYRL